MLTLDLGEQKERILGDSARMSAYLMQKRVEQQQRFHQRYAQLQELQTKQITELSLQYTNDLERELSRPVPEADKLFSEAKVFGRAHQYAQARAAHREAVQMREAALQKRRETSKAIFDENRKRLTEKHARDLELLAEKQNAALTEIEQKASQHQELVTQRIRTNEAKHTTEALRRTVSLAGSARRASSVTRSRAVSRSSRNALIS
jgi:activator of HSP90 ATPase